MFQFNFPPPHSRKDLNRILKSTETLQTNSNSSNSAHKNFPVKDAQMIRKIEAIRFDNTSNDLVNLVVKLLKKR